LSDPWLSADDIAAHLGLTKDTACGVPDRFAECGRKRPGVHRGLFETQFKFHPRRGGPPGEIVLGFRLRRSAWGQGYATEGSRALIRKGFTELGARRVVAETMVVNLASGRVLEKAGLHLVRVFHQPWPYRLDGRELGDAEYAVTRAECEQQNGITAGRPP
jgi:hypothetical protein